MYVEPRLKKTMPAINREQAFLQHGRQPHPKNSNDLSVLTNQIVKEQNERVCPTSLRDRASVSRGSC
jgi:hypothetical protein